MILFYGKLYISGVTNRNILDWSKWEPYLNIADRERNRKEYNKLNHLLYWYDYNILWQIDKVNYTKDLTTLDVKLRIVTGMVNKADYLTWEQKYELMDLMFEKYKEFIKHRFDWLHFCEVQNLPF